MLQLAGILDVGLALAALATDGQLTHLVQIVGQQLSPGRQHGSDVIVTQLALHMSLQLLDHQLSVGQSVCAARAARLAHAISVVGLQQTLEDIASCAPLAMRHIVALRSRLAVSTRWTDVVVIGNAGFTLATGLHRASAFRAQRIDGAILKVLRYA